MSSWSWRIITGSVGESFAKLTALVAVAELNQFVDVLDVVFLEVTVAEAGHDYVLDRVFGV